jgi:hypothetical protein
MFVPSERSVVESSERTYLGKNLFRKSYASLPFDASNNLIGGFEIDAGGLVGLMDASVP